ncbi:RNA-binding protein Musashi 2 [Amphibalanus amphitrite]|uniref:RNA-binding protein Musashi 2 n=1 Tax=Amphibalanus amphitrite TaxID=1232801 RepID=A0A6A4WKY2_AMPAM|nr:RNA-binding protein Musashi 2 [Amphibalanus amphitrite]
MLCRRTGKLMLLLDGSTNGMSMVVTGGLVGVSPPSGAAIPSHVTSAASRMESRKRRDSTESESRSSPGSGEDHSPNKIFVGGISFQTTPEKLRAYFAPYGTILDVMVLKDQATNRNRGFGFVTFADMESVNKVLSQEEHMLDGKKIDPKLATPKGQKSSGDLLIPRKVFVGGVSQETTSQELLEYFSQFGKVLECSLQMDNNTKRHRGFAFVTYENEEHSARVVKKHHHVVKSKTVECKYAQPKETIQATERAKRAQLISVMQSAAAAAAAGGGGPLAPLQQHYGRVMSATGGPAFSTLSSFRYSPYSVPVAAQQQLGQQGQLINQQQPGQLISQQPGQLISQQLGQQQGQVLTAMPAPMTPVSSAAFQSQGALPTLQNLPTLQPSVSTPYQFTNIDVSSLQGLDWSAATPLYGMYTG